MLRPPRGRIRLATPNWSRCGRIRFRSVGARVLLRARAQFPRRWTAYDAAYFKMKIPDEGPDDHAGARVHVAHLVHRDPPVAPGALLHFALLGAAIFGAYRLIAPPVSDASEIVITADRIASITAQFSASHGGRPPHEEELRAAVDAYVRDEMLYREGLALGLDRDDPSSVTGFGRRLTSSARCLTKRAERPRPGSVSRSASGGVRHSGPGIVSADLHRSRQAPRG